MFLPFKLPYVKIKILNSVKWRPLINISVFIISLSLSFTLARGIKTISIKNLYHIAKSNEFSISTEKLSKSKMENILNIAQNPGEVDSILNKTLNIENIKMINYIVPSQLYISEIPMVAIDSAQCHISSQFFDSNLFKVIFTVANLSTNKAVTGYKIPYYTIGTSPVLEVWVDIKNNKVVDIIKPQPNRVIRYKNIPEPVF